MVYGIVTVLKIGSILSGNDDDDGDDMKKKESKAKGVVKGAPSGLVISLVVHVAAFMLAGLLVVFTVVKKEEKKFVPPKPVDRPKMKLKKPKVKVKKTAKPKSVTRIVTKVKRATMPDIQLPEMSGMGEGLGGGMGEGFNIMPDFTETTVFGSGQTIGNDLIGTFYDFKRRRNGATYPISESEFVDHLAKFIQSGFNKRTLANVYRSPRKLYATCFMVPTVKSAAAPAAFGEPECGGWDWMCHYEGEIVHPEGIKFRFVGQGDDVLVVAINGKVVLNASWPGGTWDTQNTLSIAAGGWQSHSSKSRTYKLGNNYAEYGDWVTLEPGVPVKMDVIMGEVPGGHFDGMLAVQVEGEEYELNSQQGPILPMFKTAEPSHDLLDAIYEWLVPGEACLTNGPVFSDIGGVPKRGRVQAKEAPEVAPVAEFNPLRVWTLNTGKNLEGEYTTVMGDKLVVKTIKGKQVKIPLDAVSEEDRKYAMLSDPPAFSVDFIKTSQAHIGRYELSPQELQWGTLPPQVNDFRFGARVRQSGARPYNYELEVEYFAIGQQLLDDDKFILFDRDSATFTPTRENKRMMEFKGERTVETQAYPLHDQMRGRKFKGHLVLVRDQRGKIIAHSASSKWLYEKRDKLARLPVGVFFDKNCDRVYPTGPKRNY